MTTHVGGFLSVRNLAVDFENHVSFSASSSTIDARFTNCVVRSSEKSEDIGGCKEEGEENMVFSAWQLVNELGQFVTKLGQPVELGYSLTDLG
ncbi:hypothetical protein PVK06_048310 [Gossypium arboreum]|uniref:Uncharacterized protein n=1 Tax=Gossypium arboreum TaxID=29729 RepID=A0ABR0MFK8_GOSAR|nr:hypothetical protein PVK06_048310 [Gossypium arboreum]